jgi:hypothetical protein
LRAWQNKSSNTAARIAAALRAAHISVLTKTGRLHIIFSKPLSNYSLSSARHGLTIGIAKI